jgi:hypothetical protein
MAHTPEQLLIEVEDLLRTMPDRDGFGANGTDDHLSWLGRAEAVVTAWDPLQSVFFQSESKRANSPDARQVQMAIPAIITWLHRVRHNLRMQTIGPQAVAVGQGNVFDYFDEVRKIIEQARADIMFVDPYLDAEFVPRYLPHVAKGVSIRLMARDRMSTLLPAVELFQQQSGMKVEVRSVSGFHDRIIFIDRAACYLSGASFSDGAKRTPTTLTQITDAHAAMEAIYEDKWMSGTLMN